jgi:hypothetical protein
MILLLSHQYIIHNNDDIWAIIRQIVIIRVNFKILLKYF